MSTYRDFGWSRAGRKWLVECAPFARHLVIVGVSYGREDRDEIDEVLEVLDRTATVVIADPFPSRDLIFRIRHSFNYFQHWPDGAVPPKLGQCTWTPIRKGTPSTRTDGE